MSCDFPSGMVTLLPHKKLQAHCELLWCDTWSALLIGDLSAWNCAAVPRNNPAFFMCCLEEKVMPLGHKLSNT